LGESGVSSQHTLVL